MLANEDKKRLGDRVAKTVVIENPVKSPRILRVLVACLVPLAFIITISLITASFMKSSEAYKISVEAIENDPLIHESTGGIVGYGWIPGGNINITNGVGEAHLTISVKGKEQDLEVYTHLSKMPFSEWEIIERDWRKDE